MVRRELLKRNFWIEAWSWISIPTYNAKDLCLEHRVKIRELIADFTSVDAGRLEADQGESHCVRAAAWHLIHSRLQYQMSIYFISLRLCLFRWQGILQTVFPCLAWTGRTPHHSCTTLPSTTWTLPSHRCSSDWQTDPRLTVWVEWGLSWSRSQFLKMIKIVKLSLSIIFVDEIILATQLFWHLCLTLKPFRDFSKSYKPWLQNIKSFCC